MQEKTDIIKTVAVLIIRDNKVLLVKHKESAGHLNGKYGLPAGRVDANESLQEAARRELKEEGGLDVSLSDLTLLPKEWRAKIERKDGVKEFSLRVFDANKFTGVLNSSEETLPKWIDIENLDKIDLLPNVLDIVKYMSKLNNLEK